MGKTQRIVPLTNHTPKRLLLTMLSRRWSIAIVVTAAIAISYFDRQTLPVAVDAIRKDFDVSDVAFSRLNSAFLLAYALMYLGGGRLVDAVGTRGGSFG